MSDFFRLETQDAIRILSFHRSDSEMNILSEAVIRELDSKLDDLAADQSVAGLVITSSREGQFIVGADIREFANFRTAAEAEAGAAALSAVFQKIQDLKIPSVAAIEGSCLGGGLELSLACTWRVASDHAKTVLALPEIKLGLIPGAGGTQRLPRLIGIQAGLDMILTGKNVPAKKAQKLGLIDALVPSHLLMQEAMKFARKKRSEASGISFSSSDLPRWATDKNPLGRSFMQSKAKDMVEKNTKGQYPAAYKALESVFGGYDKKLADGLKLEAKLFGQLAMTNVSRSLIHLFHATTAIKKVPFKGAEIEKFGDQPESSIGVVGAGLMGMGIATVLTEKGLRVRVSDPSKEALGRGLKSADRYFEKKVERKRLKPFEKKQAVSRISPGLSTEGFGSCAIVIEAVFESLELKQKIVRSLEQKSGSENQIFATNTSAIPIKEIASASSRPEQVLGMHFFSPVEKMPLLEIVKTKQTAPWVLARAWNLGQKMGKQVIVVEDGPGFYTTRALAFFLHEAALMLTEGVRIEDIDRALTQFGFPVGPITLIDEVGIDVGAHVLETMSKYFPERISLPDSFQQIQASGRMGRKNQKGFYTYRNGKKGDPDRAIYTFVKTDAGDSNTSMHISKEEMIDRCVLLFINESVRCLEEGILVSAFDGDVGAVFGLGFPPFHGGPFKYTDTLSAKTVVERLFALQDKYGPRFTPCAMLLDHARGGKRFFADEPEAATV